VKNIVTYRNLIEEELKKNSSQKNFPLELYEPIEYMLSLGGKRVRPILVLLSCEMAGGKVEDALPAAIGIELFHNFSLVHDDIMDNAPLRRNQKTVFEKWNRNIAVLSGDAMLVRAYQYLAKTKTDKLEKILKIFSETAIKVCEGQQLDMNYEKQNISIDEYLQMIEKKTAVLLAASLKIGATIGGANENDSEEFYEFGKNIGIAFQLQDDLLDVYGDTQKIGKQNGGDIIAGKKTFLFLKAIEKGKKNELENCFADEKDKQAKVDSVKVIYDSANIKTETEQIIQLYSAKAFSFLDKIPIDSDKKAPLKSLAESLMIREY